MLQGQVWPEVSHLPPTQVTLLAQPGLPVTLTLYSWKLLSAWPLPLGPGVTHLALPTTGHTGDPLGKFRLSHCWLLQPKNLFELLGERTVQSAVIAALMAATLSGGASMKQSVFCPHLKHATVKVSAQTAGGGGAGHTHVPELHLALAQPSLGHELPSLEGSACKRTSVPRR